MNPTINTLKMLAGGIILVASTFTPPAHAEYTPGLGEIMAQTAARHIKLWYAGLAENWQLAAYEIDELKEGFADAGHYHPSHKQIKQKLPELLAGYMDAPMAQLVLAIDQRNVDGFKKAYDTLTAACNACHIATEFGFNQVQRPNFNPFTNQAFTPNRPHK